MNLVRSTGYVRMQYTTQKSESIEGMKAMEGRKKGASTFESPFDSTARAGVLVVWFLCAQRLVDSFDGFAAAARKKENGGADG